MIFFCNEKGDHYYIYALLSLISSYVMLQLQLAIVQQQKWLASFIL